MHDYPAGQMGTEAPGRALIDHTGYLLRLAHDRANRVAAEEMPAGPHPRHFGVLLTLTAAGPVSQQRLAEGLRVNRTMMVKVVDSLERMGFVERRRDPSDRRSYALHVTDAGREALGPLGADVLRAEERMLEPLTPPERARVNELLQAVIRADALDLVPAALADRSGFLISHAHIGARERASELLAPLGIEIRHYGLMTVLEQLGPSSQQALAEGLRVSGTMVTLLVDELADRGLVERARNPADRRSYIVSFTEKGRRVLPEARDAMAVAAGELIAPIGEDGDRELRALLRKLVGV
jgi:DNA-binding MarR family transcriptional regulator